MKKYLINYIATNNQGENEIGDYIYEVPCFVNLNHLKDSILRLPKYDFTAQSNWHTKVKSITITDIKLLTL